MVIYIQCPHTIENISFNSSRVIGLYRAETLRSSVSVNQCCNEAQYNQYSVHIAKMYLQMLMYAQSQQYHQLRYRSLYMDASHSKLHKL